MTINQSPRSHKTLCHLIIRHQTHIKIKTCLNKSQVYFAEALIRIGEEERGIMGEGKRISI
jgi:hypothetical protein